MKKLVKLSAYLSPILLGILGGYLYYELIGCNNSCPITGNPITSSAYGAAIGAILINWKAVINLFRKFED
ncbi:MAG: hypothetical protein PVF17_03560 [Ignavibacteria bacterium]|jgi:hypothetical protein